MLFEIWELQLMVDVFANLATFAAWKLFEKQKNIDILLDQRKNMDLRKSNTKACTLTILRLHATCWKLNCWKNIGFINKTWSDLVGLGKKTTPQTSANQREPEIPATVKAETLHNANGRIYRIVKNCRSSPIYPHSIPQGNFVRGLFVRTWIWITKTLAG